jgi:PAS domain S-box-containing protein
VSSQQPTRNAGSDRTLSAHERSDRSDQGASELSVARGYASTRTELDAQEVLEHSPCGHVVVALDGTLLFANPAFFTLSGLTSSSLFRHRFQESLAKAEVIFYENQFVPTLLLRGHLNEISFNVVRPNGERVPVLVNAILRSDQSGFPVAILMATFEATQRRLYEKELLLARKDADRIAEVVRRSSDAIIRLDADGSIQSWNEGARQTLGLTSAEAIGRPLASLFREDAQREIEQAIPLLMRGGEVSKEIVAVHKSGREIEVSVSMTPHLEAPGVLVAFSAILRDITSRKLAERALLQNEKLASVGRLASSIAHEINNPLESVTNLLYILESRVSDPETKALVSTAQEELARVSQIATHTLRFHRQSSNRTLLDLGALSESVLGLYRARLKHAGITAINDSSSVSPLLCFEGELRQVLVNLVANAFDATRSGGRLILRNRDGTLWKSGVKGVRMTVADTGTGMDQTTLQRIFEPFFSTKGIGGSGLGLWITKELVEKNHGSIKIRSSTRPSSSGTVVTMFFPHRSDLSPNDHALGS